MTEPVIHRFQVRYFEIDAQNVVFNGWYLMYFDEAMYTFLRERGADYAKLFEAGFDVQLVHTEVDWHAGLRVHDHAEVAVSTARIGHTSFAVDYRCTRDGALMCSARTVYVVVATDGSGKRPIPPLLARALGEPAPLRPE